MEPKKTPNSPSHLEEEEQTRRDHSIRYQTILQGQSNQNSLVLEKNRHIDK